MPHPSFIAHHGQPLHKPKKEIAVRLCSMRMAHPQTSTTVIPGISEIAANYKCFLLDQYGVIHDGQRVYPGALTALQNLHAHGVQSVIISNSSRPESTTLRKLARLGVDTSLISAVITSGDLAMKVLPVYAAAHPGSRVLHFNWGSTSRSAVSIAQHGFKNVAPFTHDIGGVPVPNPADIDIIVAHGTTGLSRPDGSVVDLDWEVLTELAKQVAQKRPDIPFFVANPDIVTVDGPILRTMPGALAKAYEDAGGTDVRRLGKPDPFVYKQALELARVPLDNVIGVGDSLGHDILGAANAGIDSLYIAGGINAENFGIDPKSGFSDEGVAWTSWSEDTVVDLISEEASSLGKRRPTYASNFFRW